MQSRSNSMPPRHTEDPIYWDLGAHDLTVSALATRTNESNEFLVGVGDLFMACKQHSWPKEVEIQDDEILRESHGGHESQPERVLTKRPRSSHEDSHACPRAVGLTPVQGAAYLDASEWPEFMRQRDAKKRKLETQNEPASSVSQASTAPSTAITTIEDDDDHGHTPRPDGQMGHTTSAAGTSSPQSGGSVEVDEEADSITPRMNAREGNTISPHPWPMLPEGSD